MVLNSTFSFFRTLNTNNFKEVHFVDEKYITENVQPYKVYDSKVENRPNIVIFIVESFGREYSGAFNKDKNIKDYVSYTPFMDSLATQSLIFPNTFANGRQSIHGMSSVLAGIPSLTDAFTVLRIPIRKYSLLFPFVMIWDMIPLFIMEPRMVRWDFLDLEIF
jgi:hypothetical protein